MKTENYRIGNCVLIKGLITRVTGQMIYEGGMEEFSEPVPLTMGVVKGFHYFGWHKMSEKAFDTGMGQIYYDFNRFQFEGGMRVDYLHELQNLYLIGTDEELPLNKRS